MTSVLPLLLPGLFILFAAALALLMIARRYRKQLGLQGEEKKKESESAFIINAFHQVTKQLKEKEKELERLKTQAEQRAENIESYNENILQCVTSGVMTFDSEFRLTTINRAAEELFGVCGEHALQKTVDELFPHGGIAGAVKRTLADGNPSLRMEEQLKRDDGYTLWLGYNTTVLTDRQEASIGVILSFSDLTEVKRLQNLMELRERLSALGEMSAGIAHELRNPMAVISGYLTLLSKKASATEQDVIKKISDEIVGMNRIISDLLSFARPAALERTAVSVPQFLRTCVESMPGASKIVFARLDEATVSADEGLLAQAFENVIRNGLESMADSGTVNVSALRQHVAIEITIEDAGSGIDPANLKKIFLPFFTTKDQGVGLGLALAHKIITAHGGSIRADSAIGKGTRFVITLPLA
jgi:PAS domain S-box-containing protein